MNFNLKRKDICNIALMDIVNIRARGMYITGCTVVAFEHADNNINDKYYALCLLPETFDINQFNAILNIHDQPIENDSHQTAVKNSELYVGKPCLWKSFSYIDEVFELYNVGCFCVSCKLHFDFAESNQPNNLFKCYSCKSNPARAYY